MDQNSREWDNHVCAPIRAEVMMFKFVIKIEDEEWEVFEGTWAQFLGLINSP